METERDYGKEIDELKKSVAEILSIVKKENSQRDRVSQDDRKERNSESERSPRMFRHKDERLNGLADEFTMSYAHESGGCITSVGTYSSGGHQSSWISEYRSVDGLFDIIENGSAEKVLKCIGNNSRLNMILTLLKKPMSVNQLVEECGYTSTGQIYHHLQPLINGDLVAESKEERGLYMIQPHKVQGIILILAGIGDILDEKYSKGNWDED